MYIFVPQTEPNPNNMNNNFMDAINVLSFLIGILNLDLNVTANDLAEQKDYIVNDLHRVIGKVEAHLANQDNHLTLQDKHLNEQDMRLDRLERMMYDRYDVARKESER